MASCPQRLLLPGCALMLLALGCSENSKGRPQRSGALIDNVAPIPGTRMQVAQVNGVAIFDDCVRRQAKASGLSAREALEECIDFELLAGQAKHLVGNAEVQERGKQELVRSFVAQKYPVASAADIPENIVKQLWDRVPVRRRYQHPELRNIVFCRIANVKGPGGGEALEISDKYLNAIYLKLRDKRDLKKDDLYGECYPHYKKAGIAKLTLNTFRLRPRSEFNKHFRELVFDGEEESGMVLPPLHTRFGWDLILITDVREEKNIPYAVAQPELREALFSNPIYESWRDSYFADWVEPFAQNRQIQRFPENILISPTLPDA